MQTRVPRTSHSTRKGLKTGLLVLVVLFLSSAAMAAPNVLVLNSYHPGYVWADAITKGIRSGLRKAGLPPQVSYEYMDTKRLAPEVMFPEMLRLLSVKYAATDFDVLIAADNNALAFLIANRERLFPDVPIVFCGINGFTPDLLRGKDGVTGVAEDYDLKGTLDLALSMHPETRDVAIVSGISTSSRINQARIRSLEPLYASRVRFLDFSLMEPEALKMALSELSEESIVLYLSYYRTPGGVTLSVAESTALVHKAAGRPIYSPWDYTLGHGVLGGRMLRAEEQGRLAGEMAASILSGADLHAIPVLRNSSVEPVFDFNYLAENGLSPEDLPEGTRLVNAPVPSYLKYRRYLGAMLAFIFLQTTLILVLRRLLSRARKAETSLKREEERLEALLELQKLPGYAFDRLLAATLEKAMALTRSSRGTLLFQREREADFLQVMPNGASTSLTDLPPEWKPALASKRPLLEQNAPSRLLLPVTENGRFVALVEVSGKSGSYTENDTRQLTLLIKGMLPALHQKEADDRERRLEARLQQSRKLEALGTFAGGIAHDFNNILGAITTCSELAIGDIPATNPASTDVRQILKSARKGKNLVRQILEYSREQDDSRQPVQMVQLLRESVRSLPEHDPAGDHPETRHPGRLGSRSGQSRPDPAGDLQPVHQRRSRRGAFDG